MRCNDTGCPAYKWRLSTMCHPLATLPDAACRRTAADLRSEAGVHVLIVEDLLRAAERREREGK